jgi:uncharacterized cupin superfamily protein
MKRYNLHAAETSFDEDDPEGYKTAYVRVGPEIGAAMLGATIYDLPVGQSICPYHYEYGNEEWLLVLDGRPTLRHVEGEEELAPGDVVNFPVGPEGAHKVTNRTDAPVRVVIFSTKHEPGVAVYPDSDKIGVWPGDKRDHILVRRESVVDYWDREL